MKLKAALSVFSILVIAWLILPTLVLVPISFSETASFNFPAKGFSLQWYENFFTDISWLRSLFLSLQVGVLVTIIATVAGTFAAFGIWKMKARGRTLVQGYLLTPMMIPGIILAVGLYSVFLKFGLLGTTPGFVLAHTVLAIPFVVVNVLTSLESMDSRLELAAASLGASRSVTFVKIVLPLIAPGVSAGALFAFVTSFDEVIVSLFIQSPGLQTLPVKVFQSVTQDTDPTVAAVSVIVTVFSIFVVSVAQLRILNKKRQKS